MSSAQLNRQRRPLFASTTGQMVVSPQTHRGSMTRGSAWIISPLTAGRSRSPRTGNSFADNKTATNGKPDDANGHFPVAEFDNCSTSSVDGEISPCPPPTAHPLRQNDNESNGAEIAFDSRSKFFFDGDDPTSGLPPLLDGGEDEEHCGLAAASDYFSPADEIMTPSSFTTFMNGRRQAARAFRRNQTTSARGVVAPSAMNIEGGVRGIGHSLNSRSTEPVSVEAASPREEGESDFHPSAEVEEGQEEEEEAPVEQSPEMMYTAIVVVDDPDRPGYKMLVAVGGYCRSQLQASPLSKWLLDDNGLPLEGPYPVELKHNDLAADMLVQHTAVAHPATDSVWIIGNGADEADDGTAVYRYDVSAASLKKITIYEKVAPKLRPMQHSNHHANTFPIQQTETPVTDQMDNALAVEDGGVIQFGASQSAPAPTSASRSTLAVAKIPNQYHCHTSVLMHDPKTGHDIIVSFAGVETENPLASLFVLDLVDHTWTSLSQPRIRPSARLYHAACSDGKQTMWIFGGAPDCKTTTKNDVTFDDIWKWDLNSNTWVHIRPFGIRPTPRGSCSLLYKGPFLYLLGGFNGSEDFDDFYRFDIDAQTWSKMDAPAECKNHENGVWAYGSCSYGEHLYYCSGICKRKAGVELEDCELSPNLILYKPEQETLKQLFARLCASKEFVERKGPLAEKKPAVVYPAPPKMARISPGGGSSAPSNGFVSPSTQD